MADITGFEHQRRLAKAEKYKTDEKLLKKKKKEKIEKKTEKNLDQDLTKMRKDELEAYCLKTYGVDLDIRKKKADLIQEINELEAKATNSDELNSDPEIPVNTEEIEADE